VIIVHNTYIQKLEGGHNVEELTGSHLRRSSDSNNSVELQSCSAQKWRGRRSGSGGSDRQRRIADSADPVKAPCRLQFDSAGSWPAAEPADHQEEDGGLLAGTATAATDSWRAQEEGGGRPLAADVTDLRGATKIRSWRAQEEGELDPRWQIEEEAADGAQTETADPADGGCAGWIRRTADGGRRMADGGRWMADGGQQAATAAGKRRPAAATTGGRGRAATATGEGEEAGCEGSTATARRRRKKKLDQGWV
jgi:hypothetical protein